MNNAFAGHVVDDWDRRFVTRQSCVPVAVLDVRNDFLDVGSHARAQRHVGQASLFCRPGPFAGRFDIRHVIYSEKNVFDDHREIGVAQKTARNYRLSPAPSQFRGDNSRA